MDKTGFDCNMLEGNIQNIDLITLNREDYLLIKELADRYKQVNDKYKKKKRELVSYKKQLDNQKNFIDKILTKNNEETATNLIAKTEPELHSLKKQKKQIYFEIRGLIFRIIASNQEYQAIYNQYLDNSSFNSEIYHAHKCCLELVKLKPRIDRFFNKLKELMEQNTEISQEKTVFYQEHYRRVIVLINKIQKQNKKRNMDFSEELNFEDSYAVLSIISLLYTSVINPTYEEYKDIYLQYVEKMKFIKKFNGRIVEITSKAIKYGG